eukprot:CAMPEP_0172833942 /NCGR_PEP_ID=MMETSP1075-20121228/24709_1 /TAXON_ID=2916 /ORGANISM="Ceratium fusus, Strain PA161109" /LENGTH=342 /DNA_ID=CAMNT_0013676771 /DNA_START=138 /DNA_END=1162 /DNA_ORIENTATION=+
MRTRGPPETVTSGPSYQANEEIRALEVRIIGEMADASREYEIIEKSEVVTKQEALIRAQSRGLDLILINEKSDPPLVKIASLGRYTFHDRKQRKEKAKNAKLPNMKEMKVAYNIGRHDLSTRIRQIERWMKNDKQQVRVTVVMKGRTQMLLQPQAKQLLKQIQEEAASFARTMRSTSEDDGIRPTPRGDLAIMLQNGPDVHILKKLREGGFDEVDDVGESDADDADEVGDDDGHAGSLNPEVAKILEERKTEVTKILEDIDNMKAELLGCGIDPTKLCAQPEMQHLQVRLEKAEAHVASAVRESKAGGVNKPLVFSFVVLPALLVGGLQPKRRQRSHTRLRT